jgi:hypothetical protein
MEKILEEDENVQKEIEEGVIVLLNIHQNAKENIIKRERNRYIHDQILYKYEKNLFESLIDESKERDPYVKFIKDKIEFMYLDKDKKRIDKDYHLNMTSIYPHYRKWFEMNYPRINPQNFVHSKANFLVVGRLGPEHDRVKGWYGIRIKKDEKSTFHY